jgi:hypothetical protein
MGLSQRAYARHRGLSEAAIRKAVKAGRISPMPDGTIDQASADRQWEGNTNPRLGATNGASDSSSGSLLQARAVHEVIKVQTSKVRLSRLKGDLVDRNQVVSQVFKLARNERDAWLNWSTRVAAEMAATLKVDAHTMHVALDAAVREQLSSLGTMQPSFD